MNLDTLSSDSSEEEIRDSGSSFLFPDSWGSDLYFPYFGKYSSLPGGGGGGGGINLYKRVCTSFILAGPCLLLPHWSVHICTITTLVNNYMEGSGSATIK